MSMMLNEFDVDGVYDDCHVMMLMYIDDVGDVKDVGDVVWLK